MPPVPWLIWATPRRCSPFGMFWSAAGLVVRTVSLVTHLHWHIPLLCLQCRSPGYGR
eukprot:jgi/Botrbrau1/16725/Bobra.0276s0005.1